MFVKTTAKQEGPRRWFSSLYSPCSLKRDQAPSAIFSLCSDASPDIQPAPWPQEPGFRLRNWQRDSKDTYYPWGGGSECKGGLALPVISGVWENSKLDLSKAKRWPCYSKGFWLSSRKMEMRHSPIPRLWLSEKPYPWPPTPPPACPRAHLLYPHCIHSSPAVLW